MNEFKENKEYYKNQINDALNILKCIAKHEMYTKIATLDVMYGSSKEPVPFIDRLSLDYKPLKVGQSWGSLFTCAWMNVKGKVDEANIENAILALDINGEALLYDKDGNPVKGFTNGSSVFDRALGEPGKQYHPISSLINKDGTIDLWFDCGCNDLFGNLQENGELKFADVVIANKLAKDNYYDFEVLLDLLNTLDEKDEKYKSLFDYVIRIRDLYWYSTNNHHEQIHEIAQEAFALLQEPSKYCAYMVGHSHLDLAWLWPVRESKRKVLRTLTNVIDLLERYEDMVFVLSQPQQIQWIKENSSSLYQLVKKYIMSGRIEIIGGFYVETDTNLIGEESLARQALYGQKFYMEEFGKYSDICFLPDCFGFNGQLPQILRQSAQNYFLTTKISWCNNTIFPYHNFRWIGIDNTEVIAHFPPENTYNSGAYPRSLHKFKSNLTSDDVIKKGVILYGIGNGAGGPGEEHLERIKREKSLHSLPQAQLSTCHKIFEDLEESKDRLKSYQGELYLENHQGTYSSQSETKRLLKLAEERLKALEYYLSVNQLADGFAQCEVLWKELMLYYFHDIIPGSSIKRVYEETEVELKDILHRIDSLADKYKLNFNDGQTIINTATNPIKRYIKTAEGYVIRTCEPFSTSSKFEIKKFSNMIDSKHVSNLHYEIEFDELGYMKSLYSTLLDKNVLAGMGNGLRVFIDHGDAWNIVDSYRNQDEIYMQLEDRTISNFEGLIEVVSTYTYMNSKINEIIIIPDSDDPIEITHDTDWHDIKRMLRTQFKLPYSSSEITCDIQFGQISRSRESDTLRAKAQFEIVSQRWCDVSNEEYGLTIISPSKYGHYSKKDILDLCLLRSTNHPCENGDIGHTSYRYAIYPHGKIISGEIDGRANAYTSESLYSNIDSLLLPSLVKFDHDHLEYSTLKPSYDDDSYILRVYEKCGQHLNTSFEVKEGYELFITNILEDECSTVDNKNVSFGPYEIKTLLIKKCEQSYD